MIAIVMGVSGAGKTTIGKLLAEELGWQFIEGDDYHPQSNIEKMAAGMPLEDEDRWQWLHTLRREIEALLQEGRSAVVSCSALKEKYREILAVDKQVHFVYLRGSRELIEERLSSRKNHFFEKKLLDSQFAALEEPRGVICIDISSTPEQIVAQIKKQLPL